MQNDNLPRRTDYTYGRDPVQPSPTPSRPATGGSRVIQPTPGFKEEMEQQKQQEEAQAAAAAAGRAPLPVTPQATPVQLPATPAPQPVMPTAQPQPQTPAFPPTPIQQPIALAPQPTTTQQPFPQVPAPNAPVQVGVSASQMGLNQPKPKFAGLNFKKLALKIGAPVVVLIVAAVVLLSTGVLGFGKLKSTEYTNSQGMHYKLLFYKSHTEKKTDSGNTQLVSRVSEEGKYPLELSIENGSESSFTTIKDCVGFSKAFDVQNDNLQQNIAVCKVSLGQNVPDGLYIAGIFYENQVSIVTISQDLSSVDLSSKSGAQQSLTKFGIDPYQDDVKQILASIKIEKS